MRYLTDEELEAWRNGISLKEEMEKEGEQIEPISCVDCKYEVLVMDTGILEHFCNKIGRYTSFKYECPMGERIKKD